MTRSNSKQPRKTRSNAAQTILATYAAAAKQPKKKMTVKQQKGKNQQDTKLPKELLSSDEEEMPSDSEDDNTSSTSKKREREDDNIAKRNKKKEKDTSMETDEEIAIVALARHALGLKGNATLAAAPLVIGENVHLTKLISIPLHTKLPYITPIFL